jgi:hypothetical protein
MSPNRDRAYVTGFGPGTAASIATGNSPYGIAVVEPHPRTARAI